MDCRRKIETRRIHDQIETIIEFDAAKRIHAALSF
jgi:hypothetical protein